MSGKQLHRKKAKQAEEEAESSSSEDPSSGDEVAAASKSAKKPATAGDSEQVPRDKDDHFAKRLSKWKAVKVRSFRGKKYIDFREYYEKEGKLLPGKKGLMLNEDEWKSVVEDLKAINEAFD